MEPAVATPATPTSLTLGQRLTFLVLAIPWLAQLTLVKLNPEFLGMFLRSKTGAAAVAGYVALTALQALVLTKAYRRVNRARARNGGHSTAVAMIFGVALLGALELFAVTFLPVFWAHVVAPHAR
jgi:hypothetical protein